MADPIVVQPHGAVTVAKPDEHPEMHEHSDVPIRPLVIFFAISGVLAILIHLGLWGLFAYYDAVDKERAEASARTSHTGAKPQRFPEPRLQGIPKQDTGSENLPKQDMQLMLAENRQLLTTYGKPDAHGRARIPVDRAMELYLQQRTGGAGTTRPTTQATTRPGGPR
jgi:hypothetical protein